MNASKYSQKISQPSACSFAAVAMDFADTIAVIISHPFALAFSGLSMSYRHKSIYRPTVAMVGVISIGLFLNITPKDIAELIKILGIGKAAYDIFQNALAAGDAREAIEEQDFYFLWRARQGK
jgi:hypothetical protein